MNTPTQAGKTFGYVALGLGAAAALGAVAVDTAAVDAALASALMAAVIIGDDGTRSKQKDQAEEVRGREYLIGCRGLGLLLLLPSFLTTLTLMPTMLCGRVRSWMTLWRPSQRSKGRRLMQPPRGALRPAQPLDCCWPSQCLQLQTWSKR